MLEQHYFLTTTRRGWMNQYDSGFDAHCHASEG